jgi:hypothetical protein
MDFSHDQQGIKIFDFHSKPQKKPNQTHTMKIKSSAQSSDLYTPNTGSDQGQTPDLPSPGGGGCRWRQGATWWLALFALLAASWRAEAAGTWTALVNAPPAGLNNSLLLSDGTVICGDGGQNWYRLTPDIHGSYINGTWTQIASTTYTRLFYASQVLTNGNVLVAGGEYGTGRNVAELYNSLNNTWSANSDTNNAFSDCESKMLPSGNVLIPPVGAFGGCLIYKVALDSFVGAASAQNQNEAAWVRLPNDNIVTIDSFGQNSEHYVDSLNEWVADGNVPVSMYGYGGELGAGFVLPNGKAFYIGATNHTVIYTPGSTVTSAGSWVAGPNIPNNQGAVDAPSAMMANGNILCAVNSTAGFNAPTSFYEYNYVTNSFTQVNGPTGTTWNGAAFATTMLDLPDGTVLFIAGQGSTSLYVYTPGGTPLAAGKPAISSITENSNGSYHLTGTGLNGISAGAAYGDDWQMDTSYPLVRMTNTASGDVYYARTYNWSSTTIQNTNPVTTEFSVPASVPNGAYSLVVVANGISSSPFSFTLITNGIYNLVNLNSGLAADVKHASTTNGTPVNQYTINGGANQEWGVTNVGSGIYQIIGVPSGRALSLDGGGTANGTQMDIYDYSGASYQQWSFTATRGGYYRLTPQNATGACLDVQHSGTTNDTPLEIWTYGGGNSQQWSLQTP